MPGKRVAANPDNLRKLYESGLDIRQISDKTGISATTVYRRLTLAATNFRPRGDGRRVFAHRHACISDAVVDSYSKGSSELSLAIRLDVDRGTVRRILTNAGIRSRGRSEANALRLRDDALAGRVVRNAHLAMGRGESDLAQMLTDLNRPPRRQVIVGRYNVDLAIESVAVEVHGRNSHPLAASMRQRERIKHLLDRGWTVVYVWITPKHPLSVEAARQVVALAERANGDPTIGPEYWVVRGSGELIAGGENYLEQFTNVQATGCREYSARADYRPG